MLLLVDLSLVGSPVLHQVAVLGVSLPQCGQLLGQQVAGFSGGGGQPTTGMTIMCGQFTGDTDESLATVAVEFTDVVRVVLAHAGVRSGVGIDAG